MPTHFWGDKDFDWYSLNDAMRFIYKWTYRLSGLRVMMKEKYGTIRYEYVFGLWGGIYYKPSKYNLLKNTRLGQYFYFRIFLRNWRMKIINVMIFFACVKWPHIAPEILNDKLSDYENVPWFAKPWIKENPWKRIG